LPLAVQVGFSGVRHLIPEGQKLTDNGRVAFVQGVFSQLRDVLEALPSQLDLGEQHFLVGISQVAIGADQLFSRAVGELGWGHRVFLPQARAEYLGASGSEGADFSPEQAEAARELLDAPHVIEEVVVTAAATRRDRFHETNVAILDEVDALVCLRVADRDGHPGGTLAIFERARKLRRAVFELVLSVDASGHPLLKSTFHPAVDRLGHTVPVAPTLPISVPAVSPPMTLAQPSSCANWPDHVVMAEALKTVASTESKARQSTFKWAAAVVVGTHVVATLLALMVITGVTLPFGLPPVAFLGLEVVLLMVGFATHQWVHHVRGPEHWAMARLCAEVGRSVRAYGKLPGSLRFLLALPVPQSLTPLLRTFMVLHLRQVRHLPAGRWSEEIERYRIARLTLPEHGQIDYYRGKQHTATWQAQLVTVLFQCMSTLAITAILMKLGLKAVDLSLPQFINALGLFAVLAPVAAVGALSFTAALDIEARKHTFSQMFEFVEQQSRALAIVGSAGEAAASAAQTESRLLGEIVTWYSRRAYTSVA